MHIDGPYHRPHPSPRHTYDSDIARVERVGRVVTIVKSLATSEARLIEDERAQKAINELCTGLEDLEHDCLQAAESILQEQIDRYEASLEAEHQRIESSIVRQV